MLVVWHKRIHYHASATVGTSQHGQASLSGMSQEISCHMVASQELVTCLFQFAIRVVLLKEISYTRQGPIMHPTPRGMTRLYNPNQIHLKTAYKADGCKVSH